MAVNSFIDLPRLPLVNPDGSINVTGTVVTSPDVNIHDSNGDPLLSLAGSLNVNITNTSLAVTGPLTDAELRASPVPVLAAQDGVWSVGRTWALSLADDHVNAAQEGAWTVAVNNFPGIQPVSGTVTANQGTPALPGNAWYTSITDGAVVVGVDPVNFALNTSIVNPVNFGALSGAVRTASILGNATGQATFGAGLTTGQTLRVVLPTDQTAIPVTQDTSPWVISGSTTVSGTVTANQGTSPWVVSGTVAATQSGAWTTGRTWALSLASDHVNAAQEGTWTVQQGGAPWSFNQTQINGIAVSTSNGTVDTGTQRVAIASNNTAFTVNAAQSGTWTTGRTWALTAATDSINLSQISGSALTLGQKTMANSVPVVISSDQSTINVSSVPGDVTLATYAAAANFTVVGTTPTDIFTITGSGTKTVQVRKITVSGVNSGNTNARVDLVKRSAANTGGTSASVTAVPQDSNNAAATATILNYTANPTLGASVGIVSSRYAFFPLLASSNQTIAPEFEFGYLRDQALYLRGTSQVLAVNLAGVSLGGTTTISVKVEWTEQ